MLLLYVGKFLFAEGEFVQLFYLILQ